MSTKAWTYLKENKDAIISDTTSRFFSNYSNKNTKAEDITNRVNQEFSHKNDVASLAVGIVEIPLDESSEKKIDIEEYIKLADEKMYKNKKSHR